MQDMKPIMTLVPSVVDERDWEFIPENQALENPPSSVDLREAPDSFPAIYNQGLMNSCSANAMAGMLYFDMRRARQKSIFNPSRLFIYYNGRVEDETIGLSKKYGSPVELRWCIDAVAKKGICSEELWPYDITKMDVAPPKEAYDMADKHKVLSYHRVKQDLSHLKACLAQGYPFVFGMQLSSSFPGYSTKGISDVPMPKEDDLLIGGHALLAVGYDDSKNAFIVRNSFGECWGENGYCYLPYDYMLNAELTFDHWTVNVICSE